MYPKLRGRIVEKFGSFKAFAEAVGLSPVAISLKMSGKTAFDAPTISRWCEVLEIPIADAGLYFFAD